MPSPPSPSGPELVAAVELLCRVEAGEALDGGAIPPELRRWFVANAERFGAVAWAALGLLARIAAAGDDGERARVARAALPLARLLPQRGEPLLQELARSPSPPVRAAASAALAALRYRAVEPAPRPPPPSAERPTG